ncbi:unnamed protein product [Cuscuta epithymum]|uniref:Uncharacterized protein n=1 Tax=Cuscuta epithymum TaxID=186058 RepID=A0AAV0GAA0_9ASTE|nr:unnamed protein product [Cuscuta epithymum]
MYNNKNPLSVCEPLSRPNSRQTGGSESIYSIRSPPLPETRVLEVKGSSPNCSCNVLLSLVSSSSAGGPPPLSMMGRCLVKNLYWEKTQWEKILIKGKKSTPSAPNMKQGRQASSGIITFV